jgi:hypothetical protein
MSTVTHLLVDIETLATDPNAVVLSVACVPFLLEVHTYFGELVPTGFFVKFDVQEQIKLYHRTVEDDTVKWWKKRPKEVFDSMVRPTAEDVSLKEGLTRLNKFVAGVKDYHFNQSYVWSRGNNFDFPILKSLYDASGIGYPFNEWRARDVRTAIDIMAGTDDGQYQLRFGGDGFIAHNPLHDAAMDAARLNELFYLAMNEGDVPF